MKLIKLDQGCFGAQVAPEERCKITICMDAILKHYKIKLKHIGVITTNDEFQDLVDTFPADFNLTSLINCIKKVKDPSLLSQEKRQDFDNDLVILAAYYRAVTQKPIHVLYIQMRNIACTVCGTMMEKPKYCQRCVYTPYCSRECQKQDWRSGHKETCKQVTVFKTCAT